MAFSQFQSNQATTGTAVSATFGSNVAVGDLVVAYAPSESNGINVTFSNSGTATVGSWTEIAGLNQSDAGDGYEQEVAYARVTGAGTLTVTATWGSGQPWMALAAMTFNEMPDPLVLQDSQYDAVTATNPDGTDMTPASQPAWVVGFGLRWGSPLQTPGADTAAGFTSAGSGCTYGGTAIVRAEYQRITATTALDMEFTTTNSGRFYLNGLIFTEAAAGGDIVAAGSLSITGAADLDATGSLSAAGSLSVTGAADLDASGTLTAAGALSISGAADLDAAGSLVAAGTVSITGAADLDAIGNLLAAGDIVITGVADLTSGAVDDISAVGSLSITGTADLDATGTLAAIGSLAISGAADLDAIGDLESAGSLSITGAADLDATGNLLAAGSLAINGTADLDAIGNLIAAGALSISGLADLTTGLESDISAIGSLSISGLASLNAIGSLAALGGMEITGSAVIGSGVTVDIPMGGSGYPATVYWQGRRRKRTLADQPEKHLRKILDTAVAEYYADIVESNVPQAVKKQAAEIVKPFVQKSAKRVAVPAESQVNWKKLARDTEQVRELLNLWKREILAREIDAEDEFLLLVD